MKYVNSREIVSIVMLIGLLIALLVMKQQCGVAVENMYRAVGTPTDAGVHPKGQAPHSVSPDGTH